MRREAEDEVVVPRGAEAGAGEDRPEGREDAPPERDTLLELLSLGLPRGVYVTEVAPVSKEVALDWYEGIPNTPEPGFGGMFRELRRAAWLIWTGSHLFAALDHQVRAVGFGLPNEERILIHAQLISARLAFEAGMTNDWEGF